MRCVARLGLPVGGYTSGSDASELLRVSETVKNEPLEFAVIGGGELVLKDYNTLTGRWSVYDVAKDDLQTVDGLCGLIDPIETLSYPVAGAVGISRVAPGWQNFAPDLSHQRAASIILVTRSCMSTPSGGVLTSLAPLQINWGRRQSALSRIRKPGAFTSFHQDLVELAPPLRSRISGASARPPPAPIRRLIRREEGEHRRRKARRDPRQQRRCLAFVRGRARFVPDQQLAASVDGAGRRGAGSARPRDPRPGAWPRVPDLHPPRAAGSRRGSPPDRVSDLSGRGLRSVT